MASPDDFLVFDTETRVDAAQRLTFGSFRFIHARDCIDQGLFLRHRLTQEGHCNAQTLRPKHTVPEPLRLLTLREFVCGRKGYAGLV